jgi:glycosyltransferase involved in cell wall biosynthesis
MKNRLGGTIFAYNAIDQDYCVEESIKSLIELCDQVVVLDCGSTDGTAQLIRKYASHKTIIVCLDKKEWGLHGGKERLSHFTNLAKSFLSTEWHYNQQADELVHQDCYENVRKAIEVKNAQAFLCKRINLWGDSQHFLDVPQHRKPVSTEITRLARTIYRSVDDAESINAPAWDDFTNLIRIYHAGFVRDKYKHCGKIKNMQEDIFGWEMDKKVQEMNGVFNPWIHFSKEDVKPITEPLPKLLMEWAAIRDAINNS